MGKVGVVMIDQEVEVYSNSMETDNVYLYRFPSTVSSFSAVDKYPVAIHLNETQNQSAIQMEVLCLSIESFRDSLYHMDVYMLMRLCGFILQGNEKC